MSIVTEDGTGKSDAQAFCTLTFADAWHLARGITLWATMSDAEKEAAIVRAAGYMQQEYRLRWYGSRVGTTQALDWPRYDVPRADVAGGCGYYLTTVVPIEVQQANAELALKAAAGDLWVDEGQRVKREKVDVLEVEYQDGTSARKRYASVEALLGPLLRDGGSSSSVLVLRG